MVKNGKFVHRMDSKREYPPVQVFSIAIVVVLGIVALVFQNR